MMLGWSVGSVTLAVAVERATVPVSPALTTLEPAPVWPLTDTRMVVPSGTCDAVRLICTGFVVVAGRTTSGIPSDASGAVGVATPPTAAMRSVGELASTTGLGSNPTEAGALFKLIWAVFVYASMRIRPREPTANPPTPPKPPETLMEPPPVMVVATIRTAPPLPPPPRPAVGQQLLSVPPLPPLVRIVPVTPEAPSVMVPEEAITRAPPPPPPPPALVPNSATPPPPPEPWSCPGSVDGELLSRSSLHPLPRG